MGIKCPLKRKIPYKKAVKNIALNKIERNGNIRLLFGQRLNAKL